MAPRDSALICPGMIDTRPAPNRTSATIPELIAALASQGDALAVVTTKPESQARLIVDHFPFGGAFARVYGPADRHAHRSKVEMIAQALADFRVRAEHATMIGDRRFDIEGALANDVRGLGVSWGFGSVDELRGAGAHAIADNPSELAILLDCGVVQTS